MVQNSKSSAVNTQMTIEHKDEPHYIGHRRRLKEKFLNTPSDAFTDYEILELMLFQAIPRKDVKPLAKSLINKFGSLDNILHLSYDKLSEFKGVNDNIFISLKLIKELINRTLQEKVIKKNVISSWGDVINYLKFNMEHLKTEEFRVLFLNKKNILIADEVMSSGTIDQTMAYPREIIKRALFHEAGALILVHNHPSGSTKPSRSDIELTHEITKSCKAVNITVHDHVIIAKNQFYSFKSNLLL